MTVTISWFFLSNIPILVTVLSTSIEDSALPQKVENKLQSFFRTSLSHLGIGLLEGSLQRFGKFTSVLQSSCTGLGLFRLCKFIKCTVAMTSELMVATAASCKVR